MINVTTLLLLILVKFSLFSFSNYSKILKNKNIRSAVKRVMVFRDISGKEEADQTFDSFTRKKKFLDSLLRKKKSPE